MRLLLLILLSAIAACGGGGDGIAVPVPRFVDATAASQLAFVSTKGAIFPQLVGIREEIMQRAMGNGVAVADYDGDGDLDVYLLGHSGFENKLFRSNVTQGQKTFTDVTPATLADTGLSRVAHFVDLDSDGDLDLVLINDDDGSAGVEPSRLWRNDNGVFVDVTAGSNFRPVGFLHCGAAIADYDRDGLLDIYVTNWSSERGLGAPAFPGHNRLYRNLGGFMFEDVTAAVNLGTFQRDSFTSIFTDFDGDHYPDIYVAVDHTSDQFWFNDAGMTFMNATVPVGVTHTGNDMGAACADIDDDGDLDLYVTNITDSSGLNGTTQYNALHINTQSVSGQVLFNDEALARGAQDSYWGWGVEFIDVEQDGDLDIVAANGFDEWLVRFVGTGSVLYAKPTVLFLNDGTTNFERRMDSGLEDGDDGRALVAFDYDRDGDLDLLTTNYDQPVRLLENVSLNPGHWLGVALGPDNQAIGATVRATIGAVTKRRDVIAGRSYLAGTPSEVHFGLGDATVVDRLEVEWADGTTQVLTDVPVDQLLRLTAP